MLRRLFAIWIAFSILGYGIALAADLHVQGQLSNPATLEQNDTAAGMPLHDNPSCDHCGHGSAHLLGLASCVSMPSHPSRAVFQAIRNPSASSIDSDIVLRPPITESF